VLARTWTRCGLSLQCTHAHTFKWRERCKSNWRASTSHTKRELSFPCVCVSRYLSLMFVWFAQSYPVLAHCPTLIMLGNGTRMIELLVRQNKIDQFVYTQSIVSIIIMPMTDVCRSSTLIRDTIHRCVRRRAARVGEFGESAHKTDLGFAPTVGIRSVRPIMAHD